ncbi:MAG: hypothetical protein WAV16_04475 [Candidatus Moraniibacteriota bacterium]
MNTFDQKTIGVIRLGAFGNYFDAVDALEEANNDNKLDSIYFIMNKDPRSGEAMGAYAHSEGFNRSEEEMQSIVMGTLDKEIGMANEDSLNKNFLIFLKDEILKKEESGNFELHEPYQGYDGSMYPVRYFDRTGTTGDRFWIYLNSLFLYRCFIFFIQKEFQHRISIIDSADKVPDCNEYKVLYTGNVWGGAPDNDWVPKLLLRSPTGRRDKIRLLEEKIKKCRERLKKKEQEMNQLIDNHQKEIDRLKDFQ